MEENVAVALITQEQMDVNTAFDFICMAGKAHTKARRLCIISPQRARKEIAKREAVQVAERVGAKSILFVRDKIRFIPETLEILADSGKEVVGAKTKTNPDVMTTDLIHVDMRVFGKIQKPYFATTAIKGSIETVPDYAHFFKSCEENGIGVYCDEMLTSKNIHVRTIKEGDVQLNVGYILGDNPFGKTICISIPTPDLIYTHTVSDIAQMVCVMKGAVKELIIVNAQSDEIETARNLSVEVAKTRNAEFIVFIDSDMRVPQDVIFRLINRDKEIIGINTVKRDGSNVPIFHKNLLNKPFDYKAGKAEKIPFIGMGVTLIKMEVFDKIQKPWFYPLYKVKQDDWRGEDYCFCYEARQAGYHIWCDVGLSKEIGHIGAISFYLDK